MAKNDVVRVTHELPRKKEEQIRRIMEERDARTPRFGRPDPSHTPVLSLQDLRKQVLDGGRGGQGDPDAMLGERMNPLVFSAGGTTSTAATVLAAPAVLKASKDLKAMGIDAFKDPDALFNMAMLLGSTRVAHPAHVLARGVPVERAYKDWAAAGGRGLSSPSMYAIEATRTADSVKAGYRGQGDPGAYVIYRVDPARMRIGRKNHVFAIGADNGTGSSAELSVVNGDPLLKQFTKEFRTDGFRKAVGHLFELDDTSIPLRNRFIDGLQEYLNAHPEHPAHQEPVIKELLAADSPPRGRWTSLLRGATSREFSPMLATRYPSLAKSARRLVEDYVSDSWVDGTGLFKPLSEAEATDLLYERSLRDARAHNRHGAPIVTEVPDGTLMPPEVASFMAEQSRAHPDTYAEFKKIGKIPRAELPEYIPEVNVILTKPFDQLWPETQKQIQALEHSWDMDNVQHFRGYPKGFVPGPLDERLQVYPTELDLQKQSSLRLAAKGGDTHKSVRAAEGAGETSGPGVVDAEVPISKPTRTDGPRIVLNPAVFHDKRDALCVAFNEAIRLVCEENGFEPVSEPTEAQRKFFADTAYADDELQLRRTILARIATLDTSVKDPTDEQLEETAEMLEMVMEVGAPQNEWEQSAVQRLHDMVVRMRESPKNPS